MYKLLPILLFAYSLAITTADIYDNSYALIIGIDKYENVQPLNYAVKDAETIQDILVNTFDFPKNNVKLLKNEEATLLNIKNSLSEISSSARENDRVLIYFAGHGDTYDLPEGGEMGYLLPIDGKKDNLFATSIPMNDIKSISSMSNSKHMLFLIDACYGGLLTIGSRGINPTTPNYIDKITKDKGRQIITAGGRGEEVIEKSEWGHSAFTLNLKRGLKEGNADMDADGYITANELGLFLNKKVTIDSDNQQTPQYGRMTSQEGEFVFMYSENTVVIQDKTTDAKLDLLLSKVERLEALSTADKTKPDLKVNPDIQPSDYPLMVSYGFASQIALTRHQLDKRVVFGIGFGYETFKCNHHKLDDEGNWMLTPGDCIGEHVYVRPFVGYYLIPYSKTNIFNPLILFSVYPAFEEQKNEELGLKDRGTEINYLASLSSQFVVFKYFGISYGYWMAIAGAQYFNEYGELYVDKYEFFNGPLISLDLIIPFSKNKD